MRGLKTISPPHILLTGLCCGLLLATGIGFMYQQNNLWQRIEFVSEPENAITSLHTFPTNPSTIYVGTRRALFVNPANEFLPILRQNGHDLGVHDVDQDTSGLLYAATDLGLFISSDQGDHWEIVYSAGQNDSAVLTVEPVNGEVYLGTTEGLYSSTNRTSWRKHSGVLGRGAVYQLAARGQNLWAATNNSLVKLDLFTKTAQTIFSLSADEAEDELEVPSTDEESLIPEPLIKALEILDTHLYLATVDGVFQSSDEGKYWQKLNSDSLIGKRIVDMAVTPVHNVYVATDSGVFVYVNQSWEEVPLQGMPSTKILCMDFSQAQQRLYVGTEHGIFYRETEAMATSGWGGLGTSFQSQQLRFKEDVVSDYAQLEEHLHSEPTIEQVHAWAIEYADVHPNKIKSWHKQSRVKALFPSVSFGLARGDGELLHWDTTPNPDNLLHGDDYTDWDVDFSWDVGDLIWSSNQTSIDSRSKLMVELREDILDQVTRLYFERRRIQLELLAVEGLTAPERIERQMRMDELTALINGYTAGKFSKAIKSSTRNTKSSTS